MARDATTRRRFLSYLAVAGVGAQTLLRSGDARAAVDAARNEADEGAWPEMRYRTLGRTGFEASRLVFGCGAALSRGRKDALLERAFDSGVNVFDVGFRPYYRDAEQNLGPFLKKVRDRIFLISKAMVPLEIEPDEIVSAGQAKEGARGWSAMLDDSLRELDVDHVDAYYLMASNNPTLVGSDELLGAFEAAKAAGKVSHLGLSTHQNAANVLDAAIETDAFSLAMIAITPAGWYDWEDKGILAGTATMKQLAPRLARAREAGIGLVGMKAGRYLAGRKFLGWGKSDAFDEHYGQKLLASDLSAFQRSYAYVLENGLDVVNADMSNFGHLRENFAAAATSDRFVA
jgi:aryl-alcohol dehydrogenase-like predicted oxidoreductase